MYVFRLLLTVLHGQYFRTYYGCNAYPYALLHYINNICFYPFLLTFLKLYPNVLRRSLLSFGHEVLRFFSIEIFSTIVSAICSITSCSNKILTTILTILF